MNTEEVRMLINLVIVSDLFMFIMIIVACFAIVSMSKSLKSIRNLYFRLHWDEVEKFRLQDKNEK